MISAAKMGIYRGRTLIAESTGVTIGRMNPPDLLTWMRPFPIAIYHNNLSAKIHVFVGFLCLRLTLVSWGFLQPTLPKGSKGTTPIMFGRFEVNLTQLCTPRICDLIQFTIMVLRSFRDQIPKHLTS
jgi:hypothetical protein